MMIGLDKEECMVRSVNSSRHSELSIEMALYTATQYVDTLCLLFATYLQTDD